MAYKTSNALHAVHDDGATPFCTLLYRTFRLRCVGFTNHHQMQPKPHTMAANRLVAYKILECALTMPACQRLAAAQPRYGKMRVWPGPGGATARPPLRLFCRP